MKRIICSAICIGFLLTGCHSSPPISTIPTEISTVPTSLQTETSPVPEIDFISPPFSADPSEPVIQEENCGEPSAAVIPSTVAAPVKQSPAISAPQLKEHTIPKPQLPHEETKPPIVTSKPAIETVPVLETEPIIIEILPIPETSAPPATTQPLETTPPSEPSAPPETPPATEPVETTPPQCNHNWQRVDYPEAGHYEEYNACGCGFRFSDVSSYDAHVAQYAGTAEMFTVHGHWGTASQWIVDTAGYSEWYCSTCGEYSNSQP